MKTLLVSITSIFIILATNAQNSDIAFLNANEVHFTFKNVKAKTAEANTKTINVDYLEKNRFKQSSLEVRNLQNEIATFNLKESSVYDDTEEATYQIVFNKQYSKAIVTYNNNGEILASEEIFKNIKIPLSLRVKISKENPGWSFKRNLLTIIYNNDARIKKAYRVTITDGKRDKSLKFEY